MFNYPGNPVTPPQQDPYQVYDPGYGPFVPDVSLEPPDVQHEYLAGLLEMDDLAAPAPYTNIEGWGEGTYDEAEIVTEAVMDEAYVIAPDLESDQNTIIMNRIADAYRPDFYRQDQQLDDQYHGLGVNPGVENVQPIEYGRTQAVPEIPSAIHGWDAWSGRPAFARVARMFNNFPGYNAQTKRRMGEYPVEKMVMPYSLLTMQYRDMLLVELKRRGVHDAVVTDVPSVPVTETVSMIDPMLYYTVDPIMVIGEEGVLP